MHVCMYVRKALQCVGTFRAQFPRLFVYVSLSVCLCFSPISVFSPVPVVGLLPAALSIRVSKQHGDSEAGIDEAITFLEVLLLPIL